MTTKTFENFLPDDYNKMEDDEKYRCLKKLCIDNFKVKKPNEPFVIHTPKQRWTPLEEKWLIYHTLNLDVDEITIKNKRTLRAILSRILDILNRHLFNVEDVEFTEETPKLADGTVPRNAYSRWTVEDEETLVNELKNDTPMKEIMKLLGRSKKALQIRLGEIREKELRSKAQRRQLQLEIKQETQLSQTEVPP